MKLAIYLSAVPNNKSELKIAALKRFGFGASISGDRPIYVNDNTIVDADLAVMQGFVHNDVSRPHLLLRKQILERSKKTIIIDSNLFQFADVINPNYYLRYSVNGIFPTTGYYFDNDIDSTRWSKISRKLACSLLDYRTKADNILVCTQRVDGWSMTGVDVQTWLNQTVNIIKSYTTRPIVIRRHPGDKQQRNLIAPIGTKFSTAQHIVEDLNNAWATVTFNSSPGVASLIRGVPVFVTDPNPQRSQTWPVCNTNLANIENPELFDRQEWIHRLSQSHWNEDEVNSGEAWAFMKSRLNF